MPAFSEFDSRFRDKYVAVKMIGRRLVAWSSSGYMVTLDASTGAVRKQVWTK
jgi:hypothetical protein